MGVFLFSLKMLKKEYKKAAVYAMTLMFTVAVCFIFFDIMSNTLLASQEAVKGGNSWQEMYVPISTVLAFLVILFCCAMIIFANNYFLSGKTKELAIMSTSGMNFFDLTLYLLYQTITIVLIVSPLGLLIGYLFSVLTHYIMYTQLSINASIFVVTLEPFYNTFFSVLAMLFAVLLYSSGFVHRNDVQEMLSVQTVNAHKDVRIIKFPKQFYIFVYIFALLLMIVSEYSVGVFIFPCLIGIAGAGGMMNYVVPDLFSKLKSKKYLDHQIELISISNLSYSLKKSILLVSLYSLSSAVMSALMISQQGHIKDFITIVIGYVVIILLLSIGLLYKYASEAMNRKIFFFNLYKLGYTRSKLRKIIKSEVISYYSLIILIPFIYILIMLIRCFIHNDITITFALIILAIEILPPIFICLITYFNYKKTALSLLEEGIKFN